MARVVIQFEGQEWTVELKDGPNIVGRSSSCTIPIRDVSLSREHCEIVLSAPRCLVRDRGSRNGTLLNGVRITEQVLNPGDRIQVGKSVLYFEKKPAETAAAAAKRSESRKTVRSLIRDFAVWSVGGPVPWGWILGGIAVVAAAGLAVGLVGLPRAEETLEADPANLLERLGTFETGAEGNVPGWQLRPEGHSRIAIESGRARGGTSALVLEKSGEPSDLLVECGAAPEFVLTNSRRATFQAWARAEAFAGGRVALKATWTTTPKGPVLLEEYSAPASVSDAWSSLSGEFVAPPGAGGLAVALCAFGRSGRIYFDDARLAWETGGEASSSAKLGIFDVHWSGTGVFQVAARDRRYLANVQLHVVSEKDGASPQALATDVEVKAEAGRVTVAGRIPSPVDFRPLEFRQELIADREDLGISYTVSGEGMRQLDRLVLSAVAPRVERITGLPSEGERGTPQIVLRSDKADVVLEYPKPARVRSVAERGGQRLIHEYSVDRGASQMTVVVRVRAGRGASGAGGAPTDLVRTGQDLVARGEPGAALSVLQTHLPGVRDAATRAKVADEIARLEQEERREWAEVEAAAFRAEISRRPELFDRALQRLAAYEGRWGGDARSAGARGLRTGLEELAWESAREAGAGRAARLLERARLHSKSGNRVLASAVCETILSRYAETPAAREATAILKEMQTP